MAKPPTSGTARGIITPASGIARLTAVARDTNASHAAKLDSQGNFTIPNLDGDRRWDLCLELKDGRRVEGIDLDFADSRLLRLAQQRRKALGLPPEPSTDFTAEDAAALVKYAAELGPNDFLEINRPLYIQGHGRRATMLVERLRDRDFYSGAGQMIWRVELWYFQNDTGGWERVANQERVLERYRGERGPWVAMSIEYRPELSVYIGPDGTSEPVRFDIPPQADPTRGRPDRTAPDLKTAPHLLGVASRPATQP